MEWISVKDRLPKYKDFVLVSFGKEVQILPCWFTGEYWFQYDVAYHVTEHVTHWMPLPAPPDEI